MIPTANISCLVVGFSERVIYIYISFFCYFLRGNIQVKLIMKLRGGMKGIGVERGSPYPVDAKVLYGL